MLLEPHNQRPSPARQYSAECDRENVFSALQVTVLLVFSLIPLQQVPFRVFSGLVQAPVSYLRFPDRLTGDKCHITGGKTMSKADLIFIDMCKDILDNGTSSEGGSVRAKWPDGEPAHTVKKFGVVNRYDLSEEFPILTLRPTNLKAAIDEVLWIWQKKSSHTKDLNSRIWDSWKGPDGTIGKAYGYQLGIKHKYAEGEFDQVDRVLYDLLHNPQSRRMIVSMYNHCDLQEMNLYPCAYSVTFNVSGKRLNAILHQRSQDVLVANNWNVCQYATLVHMFARASSLEAGELLHVIADAHIYDRHIPFVRELIERSSYPAPKLVINPGKTDFYEFRVEDFVLENYKKNSQIKDIPIAI